MAKKIVKEEIKEIERTKSYFFKEIDMIVVSHFVDWTYFTTNVQSWLEEIPIKTLYFGCNNSNEVDFKSIKEYLEPYDKIKFIDQRGIKTLGMQITDLMKRVETEWFVYCHVDVKLMKHSFMVMEAEINSNGEKPVGIIESDRVQMDYDKKYSYPTLYPYYYFRPRSFSGFQLILKKSIQNAIDKIEDDYVYRNEDIIFQNVCENNGYQYIKCFCGMHIHTSSNVNQMWTPQGILLPEREARKVTYDMQVKGIVKYCIPNELTKRAWSDAFGICIKEANMDVRTFINNFVVKVNPIWEEAIWEIIHDLLKWAFR